MKMYADKAAAAQDLCELIGVKPDDIFNVFDPRCGQVLHTLMVTSDGQLICDDPRVDAWTSLVFIAEGVYEVSEPELVGFACLGTCYAVPDRAFMEISNILKKYDKMIVRIE